MVRLALTKARMFSEHYTLRYLPDGILLSFSIHFEQKCSTEIVEEKLQMQLFIKCSVSQLVVNPYTVN